MNTEVLQAAQRLCSSQSSAEQQRPQRQGPAPVPRHPRQGRQQHSRVQLLLRLSLDTHLGTTFQSSALLPAPAEQRCPAQHRAAAVHQPPMERPRVSGEATSVVTSVRPTELIAQIFKKFLKKKARKAESSYGDSRGNSLVSSSAAASPWTHYKTWITPTSFQGRSQERQQKMDEELQACLVQQRKKYRNTTKPFNFVICLL